MKKDETGTFQRFFELCHFHINYAIYTDGKQKKAFMPEKNHFMPKKLTFLQKHSKIFKSSQILMPKKLCPMPSKADLSSKSEVKQRK